MVKTRKSNNSYKTGGIKQSKLKQSEKWKETVGRQSSVKMYETKIKNGTTPHGANNGRALKINIYNEKDEIVYVCEGNFLTVCKENNLPKASLQKTYKNNTKIETARYSSGETRIRLEKCIGWYARKV